MKRARKEMWCQDFGITRSWVGAPLEGVTESRGRFLTVFAGHMSSMLLALLGAA